MAYRNKRGSLNMGMRVEQGAALICSVLAQANWKKKDGSGWKSADFMQHLTEDEKEGPPISIEEAMKKWQ